MLKLMKASIFTKLTLTFLALLLPFYTMTLLLNQRGAQSISDEITKSVKSRDGYYIQSLEQEVERISKQMYEFIVDRDLMMMGISDNLTSFDLQEKLNTAQKRLRLFKASSVYVKEPMVYLPMMGRMISGYSASEINALTPEQLAELGGNIEPKRLIRLDDGRLFMSMRNPVNSDLERPPLYVVIVELSTARMQDVLRNVVNPEQGNVILVNTAENWILSDEQDWQLQQNMKTLSTTLGNENELSGARPMQVDKMRYWVSYAKSLPLNLTLVVYVQENKILGPLRSYERWIYVILIASIAITLAFSFSLYRIIHYPLRKLVSAFRLAEHGKFISVAGRAVRDEFYYLFEGFNRMTSRLNILVHEVYEKEIRSQRSELKRLQAQINPHFLYNCFFIMGGLIEDEEYGKGKRFVNYLRDYFRFVTRNAEDHIPLADEMEHAQTYIEIQTICYRNHIDTEFEPLPDNCRNLRVPRLIVQPVIENAYKYAFGPTKGELWVHSKIDNGYVHIHVEDNGGSLDEARIADLSALLIATESDPGESTGLLNVHRRLRIMFGVDCGLTLARSQLGGLCVTITLKFHDAREEAACTA